MTRLRLEKHCLAQLKREPARYQAVSRALAELEGQFVYTLSPQYNFQIRHDHEGDGDYFAFFRYLADGCDERVYSLLFRNRQQQIVGCCQIVFQLRQGAAYAYVCDLKLQAAYRRRALKQLALYLIRDALFNRRDSLLDAYRRWQGPDQHDVRLYFVNMGGQDWRHNGLLQTSRRFALWFGRLARLTGRNIELAVHFQRAYLGECNPDDLSGCEAAAKQIVLLDKDNRRLKPLDLYHSAETAGRRHDPAVDYNRRVLMWLSDEATDKALTVFYTHRHGETVDVRTFLRHPGMI